MKNIFKKIIKWCLIIVCVFFVQTCTKALFKELYKKSQRTEMHDNEYNKKINVIKKKISSNDESVLKEMSKVETIEEKLKILTNDINKYLPQKIGNMTLKYVEQHNKEIRYHIIINGDDKISEEQWHDLKHNMLYQIKYTDQFTQFKKYEVTMSYYYYNENNTLIRNINIEPEDYL